MSRRATGGTRRCPGGVAAGKERASRPFPPSHRRAEHPGRELRPAEVEAFALGAFAARHPPPEPADGPPRPPQRLPPRAVRRTVRPPASATVSSPDRMPPQFTSMSSRIRSYIGVLVASLMEGGGLQPKTLPRPVVKQSRLAPPATWPVAPTGS